MLPCVGDEPDRICSPYVNVDRSGIPLCMPEPDCYVSAALNRWPVLPLHRSPPARSR